MSGLRVISGKAKGRIIKAVPGVITRPITDRAKESLFNILSGDIKGASFLDLFAGSGSVGIEALSRGSAFVRFVDKNRQPIDTINNNLKLTGLYAFAEVLRMDAFTLLERPPDRRFDYVFIAPPQFKETWKHALKSLDENHEWITQDAWIIAQIHPIEYEELTFKNLSEFDQRRYGSTLFVFYQKIDRGLE
jgi:16S rRNA (guanine966-N2)-methyltransferase